MRYCGAKLELEQKDFAYRVYVTDALQTIAENTANFARGSYPSRRFMEIIEGVPTDNRTAEEITEEVVKGAGLIARRKESGVSIQ